MNNFLGSTRETVLDKIDELVKCKPSSLIVHAGTNDLTKGKNVLNNVKKIVKEVKRISPNTKIAFSSITIRKDKKGIDKNVVETNARLKNYCSQKKLDYIENTNIQEEYLGVKKLLKEKAIRKIIIKKKIVMRAKMLIMMIIMTMIKIMIMII